jgi:hypothetical protein
VTYLITDHHKDWLGQWWIVQSWWERASFRPSFLPSFLNISERAVYVCLAALLYYYYYYFTACLQLVFITLTHSPLHQWCCSQVTFIQAPRWFDWCGYYQVLALPFNCASLHLVHHNDGSLVSSFTVMETKEETGDPLPKVTSSSLPSITTWTRFFPILHCSVVHVCSFSTFRSVL